MQKRTTTNRYVRATLFTAALSAGAGLAGCHSRFVEATIDNQGSRPLHVVEVDYPSAGFGTSTIAGHSQYRYRFKVLGSGSMKLSFTDDNGIAHTSSGPELDEGQEGTLSIVADESEHIHWSQNLKLPQ
jgi:hypothetical protein